MTDEIKEILDKLDDLSNYAVIYNIKINSEEAKTLLDYITNLQQENERLNNKIKEQNLLLIEFQDMEQKVDIYKSRCEKTMELLKLPIVYETHQENGERDELLKRIRQSINILNGSDENERRKSNNN